MGGAAKTIRALSLAVAVLAVSCTNTAPVVTHTEYRYSLAAPIEDLHPGQALTLSWKVTAMVVRGEVAPSKVRLCAAIVGPYQTVDDLKGSTTPAGTCPIRGPGIVSATGTAEADLAIGAPVDQQLTLPVSIAPGYYDLLSVIAYGQTDTSNSMSSAGIVRIVAAR